MKRDNAAFAFVTDRAAARAPRRDVPIAVLCSDAPCPITPRRRIAPSTGSGRLSRTTPGSARSARYAAASPPTGRAWPPGIVPAKIRTTPASPAGASRNSINLVLSCVHRVPHEERRRLGCRTNTSSTQAKHRIARRRSARRWNRNCRKSARATNGRRVTRCWFVTHRDSVATAFVTDRAGALPAGCLAGDEPVKPRRLTPWLRRRTISTRPTLRIARPSTVPTCRRRFTRSATNTTGRTARKFWSATPRPGNVATAIVSGGESHSRRVPR